MIFPHPKQSTNILPQHIAIVGTDTNVGKTIVTGALARKLHQEGHSVITQKWVQTGAKTYDDVLEHLRIMDIPPSVVAPYISSIAPYIFSLPASPHLAAENEQQSIDVSTLISHTNVLQRIADTVLIETAGGLHVPLNRRITMIDLLSEHRIPCILVIANKLGCINHSLLSINALAQYRVPLLGCIINHPAPGPIAIIEKDNIQIIDQMGNKPILGVFPHVDRLASHPDTNDTLVQHFRSDVTALLKPCD